MFIVTLWFLYVCPLVCNAYIFTMLKIKDRYSEDKVYDESYTYKKIMLINLTPILNFYMFAVILTKLVKSVWEGDK